MTGVLAVAVYVACMTYLCRPLRLERHITPTLLPDDHRPDPATTVSGTVTPNRKDS